MFEHHTHAVLSRAAFVLRMMKGFGVSLLLVAVSIAFGMCGYHYFENFDWIDSFADAAMILSGMGPLSPLKTTGGKLFAGFYALYSGLAFIGLVGIALTPIIHRVLHQLHAEEQAEDRDDTDKS